MKETRILYILPVGNPDHLDILNVEIGIECQIFVIVTFLTAAKLYNLGPIQGIIRVH